MILLELEGLLEFTDEPQKSCCYRLYADHQQLIDRSPGSRKSHHDWTGGYKHHIEQSMNYFIDLYVLSSQLGHLVQLPPDERFTISDGLVVLFLHDIEKPFVYTASVALADKDARREFRKKMIAEYSFNLNENQRNALDYVEGVRDEDYIPGERVDKPLAVFCHAADNYSARVLYNSRTSR